MTIDFYGGSCIWEPFDSGGSKDLLPKSHKPQVDRDYGDGYSDTVGLTIVEVELRNGDEEELMLHFEGGKALRISDSGQECCEVRYLRTDDDISRFLPAKFLGLLIKEATFVGESEEMSDVHEVVFVDVLTSQGPITFSAHNEHNGYYSGFTIACEVIG